MENQYIYISVVTAHEILTIRVWPLIEANLDLIKLTPACFA